MSCFLRWLTVVCLFFAVLPLPYDYYTLLRFLVFGVTAHGAVEEKGLSRMNWVWCLGFIAVGYNPLFRVHLNKQSWIVINLLTAIILIVWLIRRKISKDPEPK